MKKVIPSLLLFVIVAMTSCHHEGKSQSAVGGSADTTTLQLYLDSAETLFLSADYKQSLTMAKMALEVGRELHDTTSVSDALSYVMSDYQQLGVLDSAITTARELLELDKLSGDADLLSNDYNNIAYIYMGNKQYDLAREFIEKAIDMEKRVEGSPRLATRYGIASEIYLHLSKSEACTDSIALRQQALEFINLSYRLEESGKDTLRMGRRLSQKADVLVAMSQMSEAEHEYIKAIDYLESVGERHSLGITYLQLGSLYISQKKNAEAIELLEKSLLITKEEHEQATLMRVYQKMSDAYKSIDTQKSLDYLSLYTQTKDSIYRDESARSLAEFQVSYDTDSEREKAASKHRQLIVVVCIGICAAIVFVLLIIRLCIVVRNRNRHNRLLRAQILELKEQMADQEKLFLEKINHKEPVAASVVSEEDCRFIEKLHDVIFQLMGKKDVTAENIASELCITSQQLRRKLKSIKGATPIAYINAIRMDYARQLLAERKDLTIEQVGLLCSFGEATNFSRSFKKETGMTPSQYRESLL